MEEGNWQGKPDNFSMTSVVEFEGAGSFGDVKIHN
jgi:hypothetical protein